MENKKGRWWDPWSALILIFALLTAALRLNDTRWTEDLTIITTLTFFGSILGIALGASRFPSLLVALFSVVFSVFFIPWQLGTTMTGKVYWGERILSIGGRLGVSLGEFFNNQPLTDPILFLTNMAILFWLVSLIAGYRHSRHGRPWEGLIIAGIALLVIDIYDPEVARRGTSLAIFILLSLLLVTHMAYRTRNHSWEERRVAVDSDTLWNLSRAALLAGLVIVVLAWNASTIANAFSTRTSERRDLLQVWNKIRIAFENATAPLRGSIIIPVEYFDDELTLGSGAVLGDELIFTVDPSLTGRRGVPYYWRMRSYNLYLNGQWYSTIDTFTTFDPGDPVIEYGDLIARHATRFTFVPQRNMSMLYAPSLPLNFSRPVMLVGEDTGKGIWDITTVEIDPMLRSGETYMATSWIAAPTQRQLRETSTDYPEWVTDSYLQLPDNLPPSIRKLAREITRDQDTPFDKATAVTTWLRDNIEYTQMISGIPVNEDPIAWMLFNQKKGFCNYYASAHVLMLRSLGIPARLVVGYAQGTLDRDSGIYAVRDKDRHAWSEVYFPGYGWIEFEPTTSLQAINRPSGVASTDDPDSSGDSQSENDGRDPLMERDFERDMYESRSELTPEQPQMSIGLLIGLITASLAILIIFILIRYARNHPERSLPVLIEKAFEKRGWKPPSALKEWSNYNKLTSLERAFYSIHQVGNLLGLPPTISQTPAEQVKSLSDFLPEAGLTAAILLGEYQKGIYSPYPAELSTAQGASRDLWKLALKTRAKDLIDFLLVRESINPRRKIRRFK